MSNESFTSYYEGTQDKEKVEGFRRQVVESLAPCEGDIPSEIFKFIVGDFSSYEGYKATIYPARVIEDNRAREPREIEQTSGFEGFLLNNGERVKRRTYFERDPETEILCRLRVEIDLGSGGGINFSFNLDPEAESPIVSCEVIGSWGVASVLGLRNLEADKHYAERVPRLSEFWQAVREATTGGEVFEGFSANFTVKGTSTEGPRTRIDMEVRGSTPLSKDTSPAYRNTLVKYSNTDGGSVRAGAIESGFHQFPDHTRPYRPGLLRQ